MCTVPWRNRLSCPLRPSYTLVLEFGRHLSKHELFANATHTCDPAAEMRPVYTCTVYLGARGGCLSYGKLASRTVRTPRLSQFPNTNRVNRVHHLQKRVIFLRELFTFTTNKLSFQQQHMGFLLHGIHTRRIGLVCFVKFSGWWLHCKTAVPLGQRVDGLMGQCHQVAHAGTYRNLHGHSTPSLKIVTQPLIRQTRRKNARESLVSEAEPITAHVTGPGSNISRLLIRIAALSNNWIRTICCVPACQGLTLDSATLSLIACQP
jgi:hypothetical protein